MSIAVTLAAALLLLVGLRATENEPVMTRSKRRRLERERLQFGFRSRR